jgi:hypothetical protein
VYDEWADYWNLVDRMNEDYHNFFRVHSKSALSLALESVTFFLLMDTRAIWEEYTTEHSFHTHNRNLRHTANTRTSTLPSFILHAASDAISLPDD